MMERITMGDGILLTKKKSKWFLNKKYLQNIKFSLNMIMSFTAFETIYIFGITMTEGKTSSTTGILQQTDHGTQTTHTTYGTVQTLLY